MQLLVRSKFTLGGLSKSHSQQQQQQQQFINIIANSSKPNGDSPYSLMDAYINTCLSKTSTCSNGFTLVVNVTVRTPPPPSSSSSHQLNQSFDTSYANGRLTLISAGGAEYAYSPSGFYLHALHARNQYYLEFAYAEYEKIYASKVSNLSDSIRFDSIICI
jgi:hypothetical protein